MKRVLLQSLVYLSLSVSADAEAVDIIYNGQALGSLEVVAIASYSGTYYDDTLVYRTAYDVAAVENLYSTLGHGQTTALSIKISNDRTGDSTTLHIPVAGPRDDTSDGNLYTVFADAFMDNGFLDEDSFTVRVVDQNGYDLTADSSALSLSGVPIASYEAVDRVIASTYLRWAGDEALSSEITANASDIDANDAAIATNASDIDENETAIATNASDIDDNETAIATNASDIDTNEGDIATNASAISTIAAALGTTSADINDLAGQMEAFSYDIASIGATLEQHEQGIADAMAIGSIQMDPSYSGMQMSLATANYEGTQGMAVAIGGGLGDGAFGFFSFTGSGNYAGSITFQW